MVRLMPVRDDHESSEVQEAFAFVERTHNAHWVSLSKLKSVLQKQKRSAGKVPPDVKEKGRPAAG